MENHKYLVSVVMSAYNSEKTLGEAIKSILNQSYENIELLIIDDFSSDNTFKVCKEFSRIDNRVKVFQNKENLGLTKSLNYLIKKAEGKYIARQDSDDISDKERIKKQIDFISKFNLDACSSRAIVMDSNKITPNLSYYLPLGLVLRYKNPVIHGTLTIKKDIIEKLNFYNEDFKYSQDYELMIRFYLNKFKFKIIKKPLYKLNMKNNISSIYKTEQKEYAAKARKHLKIKK